MGMFSGITDAISDIGGAVAPYAGLIGGAMGGPMGAMAGSMIGGALGGAGKTPQSQYSFGNMVQGGLGIAGQMQQNAVSKEAIEAAQRQALTGSQTASNMAQFRPVGITNTFGTSNYQFDPTTGQMTSAGYSLDPRLQGAQNTLMGGLGTNLQDQANIQAMGRQYMAQSPDQAAQDWMKSQQALLAPSRDQQWSNLSNQDYNRGTTGLSVAQGGGLQAANPYAAALANSQAQQDLTLASQAQQQGQNRYTFGQGLLSSAYDPYKTGLSAASATEQLGQSPFVLSNQLGTTAAQAGGNAGQLYNAGSLAAAGYGLRPELQSSNTATILGGLANPASQIGSIIGGMFGNSGDYWANNNGGVTVDTTGVGLGEWGGVDTSLYGGANGISIR